MAHAREANTSEQLSPAGSVSSAGVVFGPRESPPSDAAAERAGLPRVVTAEATVLPLASLTALLAEFAAPRSTGALSQSGVAGPPPESVSLSRDVVVASVWSTSPVLF